MRRRAPLLTLALLATGACSSPAADVAPAATRVESAPRAVSYEDADTGVTLEVDRAFRIDSPAYEIDVHVEVRLLDVVVARTESARPGAKLELRLVRSDGSDVPLRGVGQSKVGHVETLPGRDWTGFVPADEEPSLYFDVKPDDARVPYGWAFRVTTKPVDARHARITVSGGALA